jgi:hypothetical protein
MINEQITGYRNIFNEDVLPFSEVRPFYFPDFIRINNIEL